MHEPKMSEAPCYANGSSVDEIPEPRETYPFNGVEQGLSSRHAMSPEYSTPLTRRFGSYLQDERHA